MKRFQATVSSDFFASLLPCNVVDFRPRLGMTVKVFGLDREMCRIISTQEYLHFGDGLATLLFERGPNGAKEKWRYPMDFIEKRTKTKIPFWTVESLAHDADPTEANQWELRLADSLPDSDDGLHVRPLIGLPGAPGQFIFLACMA